MEKTPRKSQVALDYSIRNGFFYIGEDEQCSMDDIRFETLIEQKAVRAIRVQSLASNWLEWVFNGTDYSKTSLNIEMTLRAEMRNGKKCWYAYRRRGNLMKRYIGYSLDVKVKNIIKVAQKMIG